MYAAGIHAGVAPEDVRGAFSWPIRVQDDHAVLPAPTHDELKVIRTELQHAKERYYLLPRG